MPDLTGNSDSEELKNGTDQQDQSQLTFSVEARRECAEIEMSRTRVFIVLKGGVFSGIVPN